MWQLILDRYLIVTFNLKPFLSPKKGNHKTTYTASRRIYEPWISRYRPSNLLFETFLYLELTIDWMEVTLEGHLLQPVRWATSIRRWTYYQLIMAQRRALPLNLCRYSPMWRWKGKLCNLLNRQVFLQLCFSKPFRCRYWLTTGRKRNRTGFYFCDDFRAHEP